MNSTVRLKIKTFFDKFFAKQHPEAALRYAPVVREIKRLKLIDAKILEVGSGSLGIVPYLKREIDGLDVDFTGPKTPLLKRIRGKADNLPFRKNSYDVAISVDVLEHIPPQLREQAIYELIKVAAKLVVIVIPQGDEAEKQDKSLHETWNKTFQDKNQFLEEHVKYGLPKTEQVLVYIDKSLRQLNKKAKTTSYPNLNINVRYILMRTWISKSKFMYYLYLKGYLLLLPVLKYMNFGTTYRRVFVVEVSPAEDSLRRQSRETDKADI